MEPVLECKNICFSYHSLNGETRALSDISFQVEKGEFLAIVGPSGCGNAMVLFWILWKPPLLKNTPCIVFPYPHETASLNCKYPLASF